MFRPTDDWWADVERDVLACLDGGGTTSMANIARRLEISEDAAASLVAILAREGKRRISAVERSPRGDEAASDEAA
jgi:DNA-binding Lrp family transcriptional regulator